MYFARDTEDGVILKGQNIISIPGQYVGRADYIHFAGENSRYFYKDDVFFDPGMYNVCIICRKKSNPEVVVSISLYDIH